MPLLVFKIVFGMVPRRAPFILRPLLWFVFGALESQMLQPRLKLQADFVHIHLFCACGDALTRCQFSVRSRDTCPSVATGWPEDRNPRPQIS